MFDGLDETIPKFEWGDELIFRIFPINSLILVYFFLFTGSGCVLSRDIQKEYWNTAYYLLAFSGYYNSNNTTCTALSFYARWTYAAMWLQF